MQRVTSETSDGCLTITVREHFTFDLLRDFRSTYEPHLALVNKIVIDLKEAEYMDSSSLGMLMSLHNACAGRGIPIVLAGCNQTVREILHVVHFEKKFEIN